MKFGKLVLGIVLVGTGALLLAGKLGSLPSGPWLIKYWPLVLVALGVALLANALRNVAIGIAAVVLVLGSFVFGWFWISRHSDEAKLVHRATVNLKVPPVQTVTLDATVVGGSIALSADSAAQGALLFDVQGITNPDLAAHRWTVSKGGAGLLAWPVRSGVTEPGLVGGSIRLGAPPQTPTRIQGAAYFSSARFDLSGVKPAQCDVGAVGSSVTVTIGAARPPRIRVHGWLSNVDIHLPANCPTRIETISALTVRSFPKDFVERVSSSGRGHATYWAGEGPGKPILIAVEGPLMRVRVTRDQPKAP
jgi:hypothetical protein